MQAKNEQIMDRIDSFRNTLSESPHAGVLLPAIDVITQPQVDEHDDIPSIKLARYMIGGALELRHGEAATYAEPLIETDPDLAMHSIRQVGAALLVLPGILEEMAGYGEPYSSLHIPTICRSQASNDSALMFVGSRHRQAVWRDGPRVHPESHQKYKSHVVLGFRMAAQHGDMQDPATRVIALSIARHHARQRPETSYGVRWPAIDRYFRSVGAPPTDGKQRDRARFFTNLMRPFDALDDLLTRVQRCDIANAHERSTLLMTSYLETVEQMTARRTSELHGVNDPVELHMLRRVVEELEQQLSTPGPLADMYQDVWDDTRSLALTA